MEAGSAGTFGRECMCSAVSMSMDTGSSASAHRQIDKCCRFVSAAIVAGSSAIFGRLCRDKPCDALHCSMDV